MRFFSSLKYIKKKTWWTFWNFLSHPKTYSPHNNTKILSTCNYLVRSTTEPSEDCWRSLVPAEQLRNRDDRHFRAVHHSLNLTDKPIMCMWLQGDVFMYLVFTSQIHKYLCKEPELRHTRVWLMRCIGGWVQVVVYPCQGRKAWLQRVDG